MKKISSLFLAAVLLSLVMVYSCSDKVLNLNPQTSDILGTWQVDQVQMVTPPTTGTASALMKASLTQFGLMNAINIGQAEANLGVAKKWDSYTISSNNSIDKVLFTSEQTAYALSYDRLSLYKSDNGGASWNVVYNMGTTLNDVSFRNDTEGYAIIHNVYIGHTLDGGTSWQVKYTSPTSLNFIYALTERSNYAAGTDYSGMGFLLRTIDTGNTWQRFNIDQGGVQYLKMISESNGWCILSTQGGFNSSIYKTNNGGANWNNVNAPMGGCFYSAYALDENNLWIVLYDCINLKYYFYKTNNGGVTFVQMPDNYKIQQVFFTDQNNGYGIGDYFLLLKTTTGGYTWVPQSGNENNSVLSAIGFYNNSVGVIAGSSGKAFKYTNITDTTAFSISGNVTNPVLLGILNTDNSPRYAIGTFEKTYPNILTFHINKYSGGLGNVTDGGGTFILDSRLAITLNLGNTEKLQVVLKK